VDGADFLQECVPEILKIKKIVFGDIDKAVYETKNDKIIIGSSSSNMAASLFVGSEIKCRSRCLIAHPVNPPFAIPIVELIPADFTSPQTVADSRKILKELGMSPAVLNKEIDGFLVNRMQYALLAEAFRLVDDDVASPQDVDLAVSQGLGLRWSFIGPFETIDLNAPGGVKDYFDRYGDSISRVIKPMDNSRPWTKETVEKIHNAMRAEVPMEKRSKRLDWRNERLLGLAVHKLQAPAWDLKSVKSDLPKEAAKTDTKDASDAASQTKPSSSSNKAVIIGSGIVGRCWAAIFARGGYDVEMYDINAKLMNTGVSETKKLIHLMSENGLLRGKDPSAVATLVSPAQSLESALTGATYVQECVPEVLSIKKKVFQSLDEAVSKVGNKSVILGSSSSNMMASQFTSELKNRANCVVCHPVNPPFAIPIVEVVPAAYTSPDVTQKALVILKDMGLSPALLKKEIDGFLVNRMQYALLAEAFRLVDDGLASPQDVDLAISQGLGLRWSFMGPFQTIDLNAPGGVIDYFERYGSSISRVIAPMDNSRPWTKETVDKIHNAMRKTVPKEKREERLAWRNDRLLKLAVHKLEAKAWTDEPANGCDARIAFVTCPNSKNAEEIATKLIEAKLAACVNIIPGITSMYYWKGNVEKDSEVLMKIKTQKSLIGKVIKTVEKNHPYDCPEVITTPISEGRKGYLEWLKKNCNC